MKKPEGFTFFLDCILSDWADNNDIFDYFEGKLTDRQIIECWDYAIAIINDKENQGSEEDGRETDDKPHNL